MQYIYTIFHCSHFQVEFFFSTLFRRVLLGRQMPYQNGSKSINSASTDLNINKLSDHKITKLLGQQNYVT